MNRSGDIDGRGLGKHLDRVLPHVQALLLASPYMGEGRNLSPAQRVELLEKAIVVVRGRVPILMWVTRDTEEDTRKVLQQAQKILESRSYKGQVFWVDTPLFYHSNRGLPDHYQDLFSDSQEPFLLHNDPSLIEQLSRPFKRNNIRTNILKALAGGKNIRGLIFLGSLDRSNNYHQATKSRVGFKIYDGDESRFLDHPSMSGVVSAGANLAPSAWQKVTASSINLGDQGKDYPDHLQQIWELGEYLRGLMGIYHGSAVPAVKSILSEIGVIEGPVSTYRANDIEKKTKALKEVMRNYGDFPKEAN